MWLSDVLYAAYARRLTRQLDPASVPAHVGVMLDGNRRWAKARGAGTARATRPGPTTSPTSCRWCDEVGVEVVTLWLLSTDNLNRPAEELRPLLGIIEDAVDSLAATAPLAAAPGRRARPAARRAPPRGSRPPRTRTRDVDGLLVNVAVGYGGRREIADAVRSLLHEQADRGHEHRGAGRGHRRRAHRRAPLHQGPARPRPGDPHLGRAAPRRVPALAERAQRVLLLRGLLARLPQGRLPARAARLRASASAASAPDARARVTGTERVGVSDAARRTLHQRGDAAPSGGHARVVTTCTRDPPRAGAGAPVERRDHRSALGPARSDHGLEHATGTARTSRAEGAASAPTCSTPRSCWRTPGRSRRFAEHEVVLPVVVITELEGKRHHPELGYFARTALRMLDDLRIRHGRLDAPVPDRRRRAAPCGSSSTTPTRRRCPPGFRLGDNDTRILAVARNLADEGRDVTLVSKDLPMRVKASARRARAPRSTAPSSRSTSGWTGMAELDVTVEEIDDLYDDGRLESVERRASCPATPGWCSLAARVRRWAGSAPTSSCTSCAATATRSACTAAAPSSGSRSTCCSTRRSASSRSAAAPAPASPRWRCAPASRRSWSAASTRKVVVFRPLYAVGGQELGYLPGAESEKMNPWGQAVFDTLGGPGLARGGRGDPRPRHARGAAAHPHPRPLAARRVRHRRRGPVAGAQRAAHGAVADRAELAGRAHPRRRPARQPAGRAGTTASSRWSRRSRATRCSPTSRSPAASAARSRRWSPTCSRASRSEPEGAAANG